MGIHRQAQEVKKGTRHKQAQAADIRHRHAGVGKATEWLIVVGIAVPSDKQGMMHPGSSQRAF